MGAKFNELKEAKSLKEIYDKLGLEFFRKISNFIVALWILLPVFSLITHIILEKIEKDIIFRKLSLQLQYQTIFKVVGIISVLFLLFFVLLWCASNKDKVLIKIKCNMKQYPYCIFLALLLIWSCFATIHSEDMYTSLFGESYRFDGLISYFIYVSVFICVMISSSKFDKRFLLKIFVYIAAFNSLLIILDDFNVPIVRDWFPSNKPMAGVFGHFNHAGYYINLGIVCAMGLYYFEQTKKRFLYAFLVALQVYGILVNSTFGSYVGTFFGMIFLMIITIRGGYLYVKKYIVIFLIFIIISIMSFYGFVPSSSGQTMRENTEMFFGDVDKISSGDENQADKAGHGRMYLWKQGLKMIQKSPILGYGPSCLDEELSKDMWVKRPDNEFIQWGVFTGIPGLLFYLCTLFSMLIIQWKNMKKGLLDDYVYISAACVVAYLASSCFGLTVFYTAPYLFMFLALAGKRKDVK